jgi:hypothetical protein
MGVRNLKLILLYSLGITERKYTGYLDKEKRSNPE